MADCRICGVDIPQRTQTCLWEHDPEGRLLISFACPACTDKLEAAGATTPIEIDSTPVK